MNIVGDLGLQSFCLRGFKDNKEAISRLKECGVSSIELCNVHVDFADKASSQSVIDQYRQAGVTVVSTGVNGLANNEEKERPYFEFLKKAGVKTMSIDFDIDTIPDCFRTAEKLSEEYDVRLGIHNHGGHHWLGSVEALSYVMKNTSERIGLVLDTGWCIDSGEDPNRMAKAFSDRLYGIHYKDFVYTRERKHRDVVVGTGILDLPAFTATLDEVGFNGFAVIEYEGDVDNPVPALTECVAAIRAVGAE